MFARVSSMAFVISALISGSVHAADKPPIRSVEAQRYDVPGSNQTAFIYALEIDPGAAIPLHTHFGSEMGYVVEGQLTLMVAGQPDVIKKQGESFQIPVGAVHGGKNAGASVLRVVATYVVDKDKPLRTPAPK